MAGYVGWEDSRVQGLLSQYDALQARWSQQAAASVRQERSAAPRQTDIAEGLQAAVKSVSCEGRCVVTLLLDSAAARELWLSGNSEVWAFFAVLSDGRDVSLEAEGERSYLRLPAAQSTLRMVADVHMEEHVAQPGDVVLLRIRAPDGKQYLLGP